MPRPPPPVEHRFKPGAEWNGNRNGRPKLDKPLSNRFVKVMGDKHIVLINRNGKTTRVDLPDGMTVADMVVYATVKAAMEGDAQARRDLLDRIEGKVKDVIEVNGDGNPQYKASKTRAALEKCLGTTNGDSSEQSAPSD